MSSSFRPVERVRRWLRPGAEPGHAPGHRHLPPPPAEAPPYPAPAPEQHRSQPWLPSHGRTGRVRRSERRG